MPYRVQFNLQVQQSKLAGWSMNFWNNSSNLGDVITQANALQGFIDGITGAQVGIPNGRVSDVANFRAVTQLGPYPSLNVPVSATTDTDYVTTAIQLFLTASPNYKVVQWIRGIPDAVVAVSGTYHPGAKYVTNMNAFCAALAGAGNSWAIRVLDRSVSPKIITAINGQTGVVTCPAHGYGPPGTVTKVRIKGVRGLTEANQIWRITVITADTFQLNFWISDTATILPGGNPTSTLQTYVYLKIGQAAPGNISSHETGRPTGLLGGRRRRRKV